MKTLNLKTTPFPPFSVGVRLAAVLVLFCAAVAAQGPGTAIPKGAKLYVEGIEGGLDQHIVAAILTRKQKLPIKLVAVVDSADHFLRGTFLTVPDDDGVGGTGYAAVSLIDSEGTITWAMSAVSSSVSGTGVIGVAREIANGLAKVVGR